MDEDRTTPRYSTAADVYAHAIEPSIAAGLDLAEGESVWDHFDLAAIFDENYEWRVSVNEQRVQVGNGWYESCTDVDDYWKSVDRNAL